MGLNLVYIQTDVTEFSYLIEQTVYILTKYYKNMPCVKVEGLNALFILRKCANSVTQNTDFCQCKKA